MKAGYLEADFSSDASVSPALELLLLEGDKLCEWGCGECIMKFYFIKPYNQMKSM